jgi:hypothetical protein
VIERNHTIGGVRVYNRAEYKEQRKAMLRTGGCLDNWIAAPDENLVTSGAGASVN